MYLDKWRRAEILVAAGWIVLGISVAFGLVDRLLVVVYVCFALATVALCGGLGGDKDEH